MEQMQRYMYLIYLLIYFSGPQTYTVTSAPTVKALRIYLVYAINDLYFFFCNDGLNVDRHNTIG